MTWWRISDCGDLGIEINPVFDGLASASINLSQDDQKLGVVFVDIGSDKTNVLIYKDNYLIHSNVIPIGSNSVTKDIILDLLILNIISSIQSKHALI